MILKKCFVQQEQNGTSFLFGLGDPAAKFLARSTRALEGGQDLSALDIELGQDLELIAQIDTALLKTSADLFSVLS